MSECGMGQINPASGLFGTLAVCDEHRIEALEFENIFYWLTIKQDGLALLTGDECWHRLGLKRFNARADCSGVVA